MTPQLYIKLTSQIARQTPEAEALEAQALALQPGIDSAQVWADSCQASYDAATTALTAAQTIEGADTTAQQDAVKAANDTLESAKTNLVKAKAPQDDAIAHAKQIRAAIAHCQQELSASNLTEDNIVAYQQEVLVEAEQKQEQVRVANLWQSAHDYEFQQISGSAIGLLAMGVMMGKPKCIAVQNWIKGIWTIYYTRKAMGETNTDYSSAGTIPHTVPELMQELGV